MIHIEECTLIDAPIQRCFDLSRSVEVHLLSNVDSGEQALALGGVTSGLVSLSEEVTWRAKHFGVWQTLTSRTTALNSPSYFQVTMVRGVFRSMQADHLFPNYRLRHDRDERSFPHRCPVAGAWIDR